MLKKLKKVLSLILVLSLCNSLLFHITIYAGYKSLNLGIYNLRGERVYQLNVELKNLTMKDGSSGGFTNEYFKEHIEVPEQILSIAEEYENFVYMDMRIDNEENPYPEIMPTTANVWLPGSSGPHRRWLGKDYRLYYASDYDSEYIDISDQILEPSNVVDASLSGLDFNIDKLGIYVLTFNPKVYNATFYLEEPIYENGVLTNPDCVYKRIDNLEYEDKIAFPEIPQKDGYIFTGWKAWHFVGGSSMNPIRYSDPQPVYVSYYTEFFATWCTEEEYQPINIEISSDEPITKGKEDGTKITLKTDYGIFVDNYNFSKEWRTSYEAQTDEVGRREIINWWKSRWNVIGSDEIMVETATRIDDKTVELVLSGNSSDKYTSSDIRIAFNSSMLSHESDNSNIRIDEDGVKQAMYSSDNLLTLLRQDKPTSGGGSVNIPLKKPTANIESGTVKKGSKVEISSNISNAKIYYTIDGSQPTAKSLLYQAPIEIVEDTTIKFIAVSGSRKSDVETVVYTVENSDIKLKENADTIKYIAVDGNYLYPDKAMTRYEILSALNNLFDIENLNLKSAFTDVNGECSELVDLFAGAEIIAGYPDNTFRGDSGITRAEFVKILTTMLAPEGKGEKTFNDVSGHWCEEYINRFAELDLLYGYPDGSFKPDNIITKAEIIAVLNRVAGKSGEEYEPIDFADLADTHWAYKEFCKAVFCEK